MNGAFLHGGNGTAKSTPQQRLFIRRLLREAELPVNRVTILHRDLFARAGIDWVDYVEMDGVLEALNKAQASRLIDQLRDDPESEDEL